MRDLCFLTLAEAANLIAARKLSPVELVAAHLQRLDAVEPQIHSYTATDAERARDAARRAEAEIMAGRYRGPLHGICYGLKDTIDAVGFATTANSRLRLDVRPATDATVQRRLREAGAVLLGKLHTYEYGTGTGADLAALPFPPARNPWDTACFTGGSSTGSGAAVAGGTAMFAIGADTGGSIRLPAAACGVVGLKATYGRVSRAGMLPNCYSLDHVGPLARSAEDAALVLRAIAGFDPADPASLATTLDDLRMFRPVKGLRLGVVRRFHEDDVGADAEVVAAFDRTLSMLSSLGAQLIDVTLPFSQQNAVDCMRVVNNSECLGIYLRDFRERRQLMGPALFDKFMAGALIPAEAYVRAQRWRRQMAAAIDAVLAECDALVCAGAMRPAPALDDASAVADFTSESAMAAFSLSGHPALALPTGFSATGLPVGLQLVGRYGDEATILSIARAAEHETAATPRVPPCEPRSLDVAPKRPARAPPRLSPDEVERLAVSLNVRIETDRDRDSAARQWARMAGILARLSSDLPVDLEPAMIFRGVGRNSADSF